ncbi:hypothetical protein [Hymenobacter sp. BT559]|uniref:hypothetical protein n=1 Tax=Hymenobacter sp. BT559 TaxID=2795729 RepID=UPI0018ED2242|nr:hypothetical protein [Hymenobacter sp. BT559]MBJ6145142.1 hypothetical protein [Hymenobacter sp. BT559]
MKIAICARPSTKSKGQSIDNPLPDPRRCVLAYGWDIYTEYALEESSSTVNRAEFEKRFANAHQRKFDLGVF